MAESKTKLESLREWVLDHKLRTVGPRGQIHCLCTFMIRPSSNVIIKFLLVMQKHGYIGEFEYVDDHRAGKIVVELNGRLNKCGVISPHFDVGVKEIEGWTARLLPSRQMAE